VWISEIMLQQTTVAAVIPYFERFLARFPTVETLAAAPEQEVLKLWEGLGYYSRARNLHAAARQIVAEGRGRFPEDAAGLQALPGIGRYTAGAIASFAFDLRAPIVEANTLRLYSRLLGYRGDPRSAEGQALLWTFAEDILPTRAPGRFNQALMELGGTVCTPAEPACPNCPVRMFCRAFAEGRQAEIPQPRQRPEVTDVVEACVAIHKGGRCLVRQRGPGERWAGLWDFPRFEMNGLAGEIPLRSTEESAPAPIRLFLEEEVQSLTGVRVELGRLLTEFQHSVTRFRIRLLCYRADTRGGRLKRRGPPLRWVGRSELAQLPLSTPARRVAGALGGD
jgi:A/G-specific adenine glycosylase